MPLCHQNQVWPPLVEQGHQEVTEHALSTRLPVVSMSRGSESLVGAWANSCRVRGRLSLWHDQSHPNHAQQGQYLGSKWVMVPAPAHMLQEILSLQQPYMGKRSRFAAKCCFHKFFIGVEGRDFPECPAT